MLDGERCIRCGESFKFERLEVSTEGFGICHKLRREDERCGRTEAFLPGGWKGNGQSVHPQRRAG